MDKREYPSSCFRGRKSAAHTSLRLCFETKNIIALLKGKSDRVAKAQKNFMKYIDRVDQILKGHHSLSKNSDSPIQMAEAAASDNFHRIVIDNLVILPFEQGKILLGFILRFVHAGTHMRDKILEDSENIFQQLLNPNMPLSLAVASGDFLRELLKTPHIHKAMLTTDHLNHLLDIIRGSNFEMSSDAFDTLKALLSAEERHVIRFIDKHPDLVVNLIYTIEAIGYYYERSSLDLLYRLLTMQGVTKFTEYFVRDEENLKKTMQLMIDADAQINIEAFYLFAVILKKLSDGVPETIELPAYKILLRNRDRLIDFLGSFQQRSDQEELASDREEAITRLRGLPTP